MALQPKKLEDYRVDYQFAKMTSNALTLFWISFLSATLLPLSSEAMLAYLINAKGHFFLWVCVATVGNTIGAFTNYLIGRYSEKLLKSRWIGFDKRKLRRARVRFRYWGKLALFSAFLPIVGDPITAIAGVMRYPLKEFFFWVTLGKLTRYLIIGMLGFLPWKTWL